MHTLKTLSGNYLGGSFHGRIDSYPIPNHLFSALSPPPKGVIRVMHRIFSKFFWGSPLTEKGDIGSLRKTCVYL